MKLRNQTAMLDKCQTFNHDQQQVYFLLLLPDTHTVTPSPPPVLVSNARKHPNINNGEVARNWHRDKSWLFTKFLGLDSTLTLLISSHFTLTLLINCQFAESPSQRAQILSLQFVNCTDTGSAELHWSHSTWDVKQRQTRNAIHQIDAQNKDYALPVGVHQVKSSISATTDEIYCNKFPQDVEIRRRRPCFRGSNAQRFACIHCSTEVLNFCDGQHKIQGKGGGCHGNQIYAKFVYFSTFIFYVWLMHILLESDFILFLHNGHTRGG